MLALTSVPVIILLLLVLYLVFGSFFTVPTAQVAVVTRFGKFMRVAQAGLNWKVPFVDAVQGRVSLRGEGKLLFMSSVLGRVALPKGAAYAATKWALEALVEALAIEVAPFGVQPALLEPGAVSSGALDNVRSYTLPDDPYAGLAGDEEVRRAMITPEQVATEIADAAEKPELPLRIPIGDPARAILAARRAAPDDVPFA